MILREETFRFKLSFGLLRPTNDVGPFICGTVQQQTTNTYHTFYFLEKHYYLKSKVLTPRSTIYNSNTTQQTSSLQ